MFRIKICGVTRTEDALAAAAAGADAVGLNFYERSPRSVSLAEGAKIAAALPAEVLRVGVFVNASVPEIERACREVSLDLVQLHGDEPPALLAQLAGLLISDRQIPLARAFRCRETGLSPVRDYLAECDRLGAPPSVVLLDACAAGQYGGTGKVVDWNMVRQEQRAAPLGHVALAGGLTPENVAEAIRVAGPAAVDTASGVESSPGVKDHQRIESFVAQARQAFAEQLR